MQTSVKFSFKKLVQFTALKGRVCSSTTSSFCCIPVDSPHMSSYTLNRIIQIIHQRIKTIQNFVLLAIFDGFSSFSYYSHYKMLLFLNTHTNLYNNSTFLSTLSVYKSFRASNLIFGTLKSNPPTHYTSRVKLKQLAASLSLTFNIY